MGVESILASFVQQAESCTPGRPILLAMPKAVRLLRHCGTPVGRALSYRFALQWLLDTRPAPMYRSVVL